MTDGMSRCENSPKLVEKLCAGASFRLVGFQITFQPGSGYVWIRGGRLCSPAQTDGLTGLRIGSAVTQRSVRRWSDAHRRASPPSASAENQH